MKPSILSLIDDVTQSTPGWTAPNELLTLYLLALTTNAPGDIVEIGSWAGRSSAILGFAAQRLVARPRVYCIDMFPEKDDWRQMDDGRYSFSVQMNGTEQKGSHYDPIAKDTFEKYFLPFYERYNGVYEKFLDTMHHYRIEDVVVPFKGTSRGFFATNQPRIKLAFIDGDHGYEAVLADALQVDPLLEPGGYICFDDAFSYHPGVDRAIQDVVLNSGKYDLFEQIGIKLFIARRRRE